METPKIHTADEIIQALLKEPYGCGFCDSGKLRTPNNPDKDHFDDCPYHMATNYLKSNLKSNEPPQTTWISLDKAPKNSTWFIGLTDTEEVVKAHYACDLSGEEQPAFEGFFKKVENTMIEVKLKAWMPLPSKP